MSYKARISPTNPSCFLFLIDRSSSMADVFSGEGSNRSKAEAVSDVINRFLQELVIKCTRLEGMRDFFEVGVVGYSQPRENEIRVGPALTGQLAECDLLPLSQVKNNPTRVEERTRKVVNGAGELVDQTLQFPVWFDPIAEGGRPMCVALGRADHVPRAG